MTTIQQTSTSNRLDYLRRAARYARATYNRIKNDADHSHSHDSFAVRDALLATEKRFSDLGTFGVESISKRSSRRSPAFVYLNAGESYGMTILHVNGQFRVGNWGDIVERGNYA